MANVTYKINGKVVTIDAYQELENNLIDVTLYRCKKTIDGGVSTETATHKDDGKQYFIVSTTKDKEGINEIKLRK